MFGNNFNNDMDMQSASASDVNQLREDATQTARDILNNLQENYVNNNEFIQLRNDVDTRLNQLNRTSQEMLNTINHINNRLNGNRNSRNQDYDRLGSATPRPQNDDLATSSDATTSTHYDLDHDVIMRSRFAYTVTQVPEPGFFTGKISETDLFCQLCEDTFKTYPNRYWSENAKVNFVKSRLRDSARNWYLTRYKDNVYPATLNELLTGLRKAFTNEASVKLAKIKLINLKQTYGKINDYIEEFRSYTRQFNWNDDVLALLFYAGLHAKYQEEINKAEDFPTKLEDIITKAILYENSLTTKNKIREVSQNKNLKRKISNNQNRQNFKNKNYNNYQHFNNFNNFNNHNYNNNNKTSDYNGNVKKISSKN